MQRYRYAVALLIAVSTLDAEASGDPGRGKALFQACAACHSLDPGVNGVGPTLKGLFGRPSAAVENYVYSPVMRRARVTWTPELLDRYLAEPQSGVFRGNKMPFAGIANEQDRTDLIAYLKEASR
jgi:cytochrome c2